MRQRVRLAVAVSLLLLGVTSVGYAQDFGVGVQAGYLMEESTSFMMYGVLFEGSLFAPIGFRGSVLWAPNVLFENVPVSYRLVEAVFLLSLPIPMVQPYLGAGMGVLTVSADGSSASANVGDLVFGLGMPLTESIRLFTEGHFVRPIEGQWASSPILGGGILATF